MFCNNCGAEITPDQKFCNNCGVALNPPLNVNSQMPGPQPAAPMQGQQPVQMQPKMPGQPMQGQPGAQGPQGMPNQGMPNQGQPMQPGMPGGPVQPGMPGQMPPKKKPLWPILLVLLIALLLVSIVSVYGTRRVLNMITSKYEGSIETGEQLLSELPTDEDMLEEIDPDSLMDGLDDITGNFNGDIVPGDVMDEIEEYVEDFPLDDYEFKDYDYASVVIFDDYAYIEPNFQVNGKTELRKGKDLEGLCDYIDSQVLEKGKKIDRDLLYDLISVNIIDNSMIADNADLENNLMYCLTFANEFSGEDIRVESCMYETDNPGEYFYDIKKPDGEYDTWVVNPSKGTFSMNYGSTQYESAGQYGMFATDTLAIWVTVIDLYYGIE